MKTTCYLDTNVFLNVIYNEPVYSKSSSSLLQRIQDGKLAGLTSSVTETEIGLDLANTGNSDRIDQALRLIEGMANLTISPLGSFAARLAVKLCIERGTTVHDAYHAATAIENKATVLITRDKHLTSKLKGLIEVSQPDDVLH